MVNPPKHFSYAERFPHPNHSTAETDHHLRLKTSSVTCTSSHAMESTHHNSPSAIGDIEGSTASIRLDQEKAEEFGAHMLTLLNNGALTLMISLGHKTGMFEVMANLPAVTSHELAKATKLNERYVREWLATMYVGGIVSIDDTRSKHNVDQRYHLPPENAAFLTWGRGPENVAVLSQYISVLSSFESKALDCFRTGTGVPSSEYGELKSIMAADAAQTIASSLVEWILPLGQGMVVNDLVNGIDVLDVECGTGINLITLAKEYPRSWFTGYDSNQANIAVARDAAVKDKLTNVRFKCMQISESVERSAYDLITCFGGLCETGDVRAVVRRIYEALRSRGTFLLQDVTSSSDVRENRAHPAGPLLYAISLMYSIPSMLDKSGDPEKAVGMMWGNDRALSVIRDTGFKCDKVRHLPRDHCNVFFFCSRD